MFMCIKLIFNINEMRLKTNRPPTACTKIPSRVRKMSKQCGADEHAENSLTTSRCESRLY